MLFTLPLLLSILLTLPGLSGVGFGFGFGFAVLALVALATLARDRHWP